MKFREYVLQSEELDEAKKKKKVKVDPEAEQPEADKDAKGKKPLKEGHTFTEMKIEGLPAGYRVMKNEDPSEPQYSISFEGANAEVDLSDQLPGGAVIWWLGAKKLEAKVKADAEKILIDAIRADGKKEPIQSQEAFYKANPAAKE